MSRTIEKRRSKISSFLLTLRQMLNNQPPQYITWGIEQNSFKINNPSRFSEEVLPKYFKHSNLSSFIRQLNIYDFKKVSNEKYPDEYIYSHPHFDKNRPQLMKNIYRKVHHLPSKNNKSSNQNIVYSSNSFQNSTTQEKKKMRQEIEQLEQKLTQLQSTNSMICEQNLQLQAKIPITKNVNAESSKHLYKILMQSYQIQYIKFAQKIHHQLMEQSTLLSELYQKQKQPETSSSRLINISSKHSNDIKTKFDPNNYNSTSSGGSLNGHSSRQNYAVVHLSKDKEMRKSDKKNESLFKEQNNEKFLNFKKLNGQIQTDGVNDSHRYQHKQNIFDQQESSKQIYEEKMIPELVDQNKNKNCSEQQNDQCPNRCVIDLKNRRNQQQNDLSRMYKAIVISPNQFNQKISNLNSIMYSK